MGRQPGRALPADTPQQTSDVESGTEGTRRAAEDRGERIMQGGKAKTYVVRHGETEWSLSGQHRNAWCRF